jgi:hypothetical protein
MKQVSEHTELCKQDGPLGPYFDSYEAEMRGEGYARQTRERTLNRMKDGQVTFRWRDSAHGNQQRLMTLDAIEFIRRYLLHILPSGLVKIRHFGFLANRNRREALILCRALLPTQADHSPDSLTETQRNAVQR